MIDTANKHIEVYKAWMQGSSVEYFSLINNEWREVSTPSWSKHIKYRVKQKPATVKKYLAALNSNGNLTISSVFFSSLEDAIDYYGPRVVCLLEFTEIEVPV